MSTKRVIQPNCDLNIFFMFDNNCHQLIIMGDYLQMLVPK